MKKQIALVFLILLLIPGETFSQSAENKPVDYWWLKSSKVDTVNGIQFHASGQYSFSKKKGVISGVTHSGNILLAVRLGSVTNYSIYGIDKIDLHLKGIANIDYKTTSHYFTNYFNYDFSRVLFAEAGYIWERDDMLLLHNRYSVYAGAGINLILFKKLQIKSLLAAGWINQNYTIPVENIDVIKGPNTAFYTMNNFVYSILPTVKFSGYVFYYTNINEGGRYRYGYRLNLSVGIIKHINLVAGYSHKFDKELERLGLMAINTSTNIGVEVSL
ncbi:MAG: hypothetical protein ACD_77C00477G0053 [uncultured bacterium]|nr:MAG: hypothetical protein ACD_77C00477G0053 [uncultured bacterium]HBY02726.1 hypothetical protein [Rikenellaceae bacterium]